MIINILQKKIVKDIMVLMSGTAFAQTLSIIFAPVLTRLFSPEAFGTLALYSSISAFLTIVVTLRYEVAVVLPKEDKHAANLLVLSLGSIIIFTTLLYILIYFFNHSVTSILNAPSLKGWLWLVPVSALLLGAYNSFNYWLTRKAQYRVLSISRIFQSIGMISAQISSGLLGVGSKGLIGGQVFGQFIALFILFMKVWKDRKYIFSVISKNVMIRLFKEYKDFPLFNASQSLINSISNNVMLFIFSAFFGPGVVGLYATALRMIQLPAGVVSNSIKQVYFQNASLLYNNGANIAKQLVKSTIYLGIIGFIPALLIVLFAPSLFEWVLGNEWRKAGEYASWLVIWLYFGFMNTPSMATIQIIGAQRFLLLYEIVLMSTRVISILISSVYFNALTAIIAYSIVGAFFNLMLIMGTVFIVKFKTSTNND